MSQSHNFEAKSPPVFAAVHLVVIFLIFRHRRSSGLTGGNQRPLFAPQSNAETLPSEREFACRYAYVETFLLYEAYADSNKMDDGTITEDFNELYRQMNGMELREMDRIIYQVCALCRDHERAGFIEGIRLGVLLVQELSGRL